jgi:hypothetical protein
LGGTGAGTCAEADKRGVGAAEGSGATGGDGTGVGTVRTDGPEDGTAAADGCPVARALDDVTGAVCGLSGGANSRIRSDRPTKPIAIAAAP